MAAHSNGRHVRCGPVPRLVINLGRQLSNASGESHRAKLLRFHLRISAAIVLELKNLWSFALFLLGFERFCRTYNVDNFPLKINAMLQQLDAPIHPKKKAKVLEAIRSLGLQVTPADVAAAADLPVLVAAQELNRVASDTNAHLVVSAAGDIAYVFDPRFEQSYALTGPKNAFRLIGRVVSNAIATVAKLSFLVAFFILRVSFGILLIASVVVIVVVAAMALLRLFAGSSSDGGGGGGDLDLSGVLDAGSTVDMQTSLYDSQPFWLYWCFGWLWDWTYYGDYLWWSNPYYAPIGYGYGYSSLPSYYDNFSYETNTNSAAAKPQQLKKKSKFLDNCFTLLFGGGDPNARLEEKRWRLIADKIKSNQGVITSEQVAPYLESSADNEDWMLPVLLRFNGIPDVTESGHIIYSFPAFQQHTGTQQPTNIPKEETAVSVDQLRALYSGHLQRQKIINQSESHKHAVEPYLKEDRWTLGNFESGDLWAIFSFAGFAMVGSLVLLAHPAMLPLAQVVIPLLVAICIYGSLFFVVPALRLIINRRMNERIEARNDNRLECSAKLASPSRELQQKLEEARSLGIHSLSTGDEHVVYTTQKDALEQRF
jgi:hypothetical protein